MKGDMTTVGVAGAGFSMFCYSPFDYCIFCHEGFLEWHALLALAE